MPYHHEVGPGWEHAGPGPFAWLFFAFLVVLIVVVIVLLVRLWRRPEGHSATPLPSPPVDPALAELRTRYARGELERQEFLQKAADLGGAAPPPPPPGPPSSA